MIKPLFYCLAVFAGACGGNPSGDVQSENVSGVSIDSLERWCIARRLRPSGERYGMNEGCVRNYPSAILVDSTPFAHYDYSFVRTMPNRSYEMCRYDGHTVLQIEQGGCEYFSFSLRWCYNGLGAEISDSMLVERAVKDTREAARWCGVFRRTILEGADTLGFYLHKEGLKSVTGKELDFRAPVYDFRHTVSVDSVVRFSDAGAVRISFSQGPL